MTTNPAAPRLGDRGFITAYAKAWSSGDQNELARFFAVDGVYDEMGFCERYTGVDEVARFFRFMLKFSSDTHVNFVNLICEGSSFVSEWVWTGTADGPLRVAGSTFEPTGRRYEVKGVAVCTVDHAGLIDSHRDYYDVGTLMRQVGAA